MIKKVVKDLLPKRLLPRLLLIFLVPLIIIQCSVIFFFYDRHWEKIINRFSNIAGNNINLVKDIYIKNSLEETKNIAQQLNIKVSLRKSVNKDLNMTPRERVLSALNGNDVDRPPVSNPTSVATVELMD